MSVHVTIHPIGSSSILLKDVEAAKKDEYNRRRQMRIKQVREQSKDAANRIRSSVNAEKENRQMAEEKLHDALLKEWQLKKIESLEKQFKECLEEVKRAEQKAQEEREMQAIMKERRERLAKVAEQRGKEAMDLVRKTSLHQESEKLKAEKAKHFKKTVEDLRSSLVSTLPHPKQSSKRISPKKRLEKSVSKTLNISNKKCQTSPINAESLSTVDLNNKDTTGQESRTQGVGQPSPQKRKRIITGQRDQGPSNISHKSWTPPVQVGSSSVTKKPRKESSSKKPRRVIHSFQRGCSSGISTSGLDLAKKKYEQLSNAARILEESVKSAETSPGMNKDLHRLVKKFGSLAEQEKYLRNQLLSQVQQNIQPTARTETTGKPRKRYENYSCWVNQNKQFVERTINQASQTAYSEHGANQSFSSDSACGRGLSIINQNGAESPFLDVGRVKKNTKEENDFCSSCKKYLQHSCADHSTTVTESVSNSSSLTYMSVSRSMIDSNNSSETTVEGVKVVVKLKGQRHTVKTTKLGKPVQVKKKKLKKPEKPKLPKSRQAHSGSGSVTSYMSPPDRVVDENHEILHRAIRKMTKCCENINLSYAQEGGYPKKQDKQVQSGDSLKAWKTKHTSHEPDKTSKPEVVLVDSDQESETQESSFGSDGACRTKSVTSKASKRQDDKGKDPNQRDALRNVSNVSKERGIPSNVDKASKSLDISPDVIKAFKSYFGLPDSGGSSKLPEFFFLLELLPQLEDTLSKPSGAEKKAGPVKVTKLQQFLRQLDELLNFQSCKIPPHSAQLSETQDSQPPPNRQAILSPADEHDHEDSDQSNESHQTSQSQDNSDWHDDIRRLSQSQESKKKDVSSVTPQNFIVHSSLQEPAERGQTEQLIDYYCNVADKYTDVINNIVGVLNQSTRTESMNSSSTSHRSPPPWYGDSIRLSESLKQLTSMSKQPTSSLKQPQLPITFQPPVTSSPDKGSASKDSSFVEKVCETIRGSLKQSGGVLFSSNSNPPKFSLRDDEGSLTDQSTSTETMESNSSAPSFERPHGNFTLDVSSITSEENGNGQPVFSSEVSPKSDEQSQLLGRNDPTQVSASNNNRRIRVAKDLSTIIEVDTPSTTQQTTLQEGPSTSKPSKRKPQESPDTSLHHTVQRQQALLQSRIETLQQQIDELSKSCSADTSAELKRLEKSSRGSPSVKQKSASDGHHTSTESELPDIVDELLKRGLISSPFPWLKELKDKYGNDKNTTVRRSKKGTTSESDSTPLINEELENILRNDLSPTDLEKVCKNLGSSWALSTWKKIAETSRLNSLSSSDSSPAEMKKKSDVSDGRAHLRNTPKHSTPIKQKPNGRSSGIAPSPGDSNGLSPEIFFQQDRSGISTIKDSESDVYDLTPPDVALHRPQLLTKSKKEWN
nr:PREDICTED: uncharacterized protein LOC109036787 [Bemisia tabaci]